MMKSNLVSFNSSRVGSLLALILGLTAGATHARDVGRGVGGAGAGVRPGVGVGGVGAGAARVATPAGVGRVGVAGVGVGAPGVGALPGGFYHTVPAGYATVAYRGYTCRYVAGVYYRATTYQGQTVWVIVQ
ncbi:hypothetical protein HQ447_20600 [bacterium]|nr:hypothetical protein [bacterium]